ncbi:hypothetical protein MNBD_BACTEROID02-877 [hydrothermal vent metagenome]|uniref:Lipoprotein n=1 Tax=hydrothermal vent metagenome TaxID=652676 RepID=A0A3B0RRN2_9ZZZZ
MKQIKKHILIIFVLTFLISCNSGYQKEKGKWVWISYDEAVGKRVNQIDEHDFESFQILDDENYAKDKNSVFHIRNKIKNADPNYFELIDNGYSKDKYSVYLDDEMVIFANPKSFQLLQFPYSKDDSHVFCGTLPLNLEKSEIEEFKVTNINESMSNTTSSILLSHFVKYNPEYKWLDTLNIDGIIIGKWATGETKNKKFKGFKELKE